MRRVLTQIANELGLNIDTLDRWIRQGKIPVNKQGCMGIYNESELNRWAEKQRKTTSTSENEHNSNREYQNTVSKYILSSALKRGGIFHNMRGTNKDEVLASAVNAIPEFVGKNRNEIYSQLMEREKLASTGIGKGIAIPHPRNPLVKVGLIEPIIITCFLQNCVDFASIDDRPVSVMFLILSSTVENHLNLLSRLSFCLRDNEFMVFINGKPDSDSLLKRIIEIESNMDNR